MNENALLTDQYELTMAASYFQHQMFADATFSLFIREYPANRAYFVSAGLEDVLRYLESFRFREEDLDHLDSIGLFSREFLDYLSGFRFSGDVHAIPEGSPLRLPPVSGEKRIGHGLTWMNTECNGMM